LLVEGFKVCEIVIEELINKDLEIEFVIDKDKLRDEFNEKELDKVGNMVSVNEFEGELFKDCDCDIEKDENIVFVNEFVNDKDKLDNNDCEFVIDEENKMLNVSDIVCDNEFNRLCDVEMEFDNDKVGSMEFVIDKLGNIEFEIEGFDVIEFDIKGDIVGVEDIVLFNFPHLILCFEIDIITNPFL
jgi:hypothetical protein